MSSAGSGLAASVLATARDAGLDEVGICGAEPFEEARRTLEHHRELGLDGGMQFTYRNPGRSTDPSRALPGARSMVVGALHYETRTLPRPAHPAARVARYATDDHYAVLRQALARVAEDLRLAGHRAIVVADDNAMVDRAAAIRAGIGWAGKSSNVLLPGRGSWYLLGSVITDASLEPTGTALEDGCGTCRRCIDGCPTGAIVAPGVVDAGRCLSWHLQMSGDFPHEFREALGDRIYGCDECQEVCPPSRRAAAITADEPGQAPSAGSPGSWVDLRWLLGATDEQLMERLGRWYVPRRDPRYLRRNALVVMGNVADPTEPWVPEVLAGYLDSEDDMLVGHAACSALRLGIGGQLGLAERTDRGPIARELQLHPEPTRDAQRPTG